MTEQNDWKSEAELESNYQCKEVRTKRTCQAYATLDVRQRLQASRYQNNRASACALTINEIYL